MSKGKLPHTAEEPTTVDGWNRAMRRYADIVEAVDADISKEFAELLRHYADGVEKAHKREIDRLRAALKDIIDNLAIHIQCGRLVAPGDHVSFAIAEAEAYIRDASAALGETAQEEP